MDPLSCYRNLGAARGGENLGNFVDIEVCTESLWKISPEPRNSEEFEV
jgi:hypothetical protein